MQGNVQQYWPARQNEERSMNTWAVLAAKQAIIASGLGAGVVPAAGSGSVDGFAIGAGISGTCMFMLASARGRRPAAARAGGRLGLVTRGRNALSGLALEDASPEMIVPAPEGEAGGGARAQSAGMPLAATTRAGTGALSTAPSTSSRRPGASRGTPHRPSASAAG